MFLCVQPVHLRVVVGVTWQSVTQAKTHTVKHLSRSFPAALISNSSHTCMLVSGPIRVQLCSLWTCQTGSPWVVSLWCCMWLYVFTAYIHTHTNSLWYFWLPRHLSPRICLTALHHSRGLKQPQIVHTHTHSWTHTNTSPCHCITTHAQARVNPPHYPPFIMHHELTPPAGTKEAEP